MCCLALSEKKVCGWAQSVASGAGALWSCNCGCSVRQYTFVKVQRWSAVALVLRLWVQLIRWSRLLQGGRSRLGAELRIAYWVRAGETATIQLFDWPAASRFQTGLTLEAFLGRLKGLTGRRDAREITRDYERMCEIGQEILGATRLTWWRRTGRAGGLFAAVEGVAQAGAHVREMWLHESLREIGQENFGRITADGWLAKAARVVAAGGHGPRWRPFCGG